jgi:RNA polymerase sigma-B factor
VVSRPSPSSVRGRVLDAGSPSLQERDRLTVTLFAQVEATSDIAERGRLRAEIAEFHLPVVRELARRYAGRGVPDDDLVQVASVGLLKAIRRYRSDRGSEFLHFALPTISGELKRHFRDTCWMVRPTRRIQELRYEAAATAAELWQTGCHEPTFREIANAVGGNQKDIEEAMSAGSCYSPMSLDARFNQPHGDTLASVIVDSDDDLVRSDTHLMLLAVVTHLSAQERLIIGLRFFRGLTQREVADELGVSQMRVSRMLAKVMVALREQSTGVTEPGQAHVRAPRRTGVADRRPPAEQEPAPIPAIQRSVV